MFINEMERIALLLQHSDMTTEQFYEQEIVRWKTSKARIDQLSGERYYLGDHDILRRKREMLDGDGRMTEAKYLPNNRLVDNQYAKLVDQKKNYLLGRPITFNSENSAFLDAAQKLFDKSFLRQMLRVGDGVFNHGIAWITPCIGEDGITFRVLPGYEVCPIWGDDAHEKLEAAIRVYEVEDIQVSSKKLLEKVEIYDASGVHRYQLENGKLMPDPWEAEHDSAHFVVEKTDQTGEVVRCPQNWQRVPLVAFRYNRREIPLLNRVKPLQDALNKVLSNFVNVADEDIRSTIITLESYGGEDLQTFRNNLTQAGVIKWKRDRDGHGGVGTLSVEVNAENFKALLEVLKKSIIENGRGFDAKDDRVGANPNQMNIQSMYSDIDLDANGMEVEFQAGFEELLWFVKQYWATTGKGNFINDNLEIIFDRDILINETEAINACKASWGIISRETNVKNNPWTVNVQDELKRMEEEQAENVDEYGTFNAHPTGEVKPNDK